MTDTLPVLHLDLETRSTVDLPKSGPYVYAEHPTTDVWVACWAIDDEPVQAWAPGAPAPDRLRAHIEAGLPVAAHNYAFEYVIVNQVLAPRHGWPALTVEQGICTAAMASAMALPRSLDQAAAAVGLDIGKDMAGRRLMLQMSRPRRVENDGTIVWWDQDFEKMARLVAYCVQDVEVERQLAKRLRPLSRKETEVFRLDLRMNSRGVQVDRGLVEAAQQAAGRIQQRLHGELYDVTRGAVTRTTKVQDLLEWVRRRGVQTENLDKYAIAAALDDPDLPADVVRALRIRQEAGKSSTSKYKAFVDRTSADGRLRDNLMYHGASTGRWCLAEGTPVLVRTTGGDVLERPIERVRPDDQVWDGADWVAHEGVVFSGVKPVIEHDGVTATEEHKVFLDDATSVPLGEAKRRGARLYRSPPGDEV